MTYTRQIRRVAKKKRIRQETSPSLTLPNLQRMARVLAAGPRGASYEGCVTSTFGLVFERELKTSAIGHHLFALNLYIELGHLGDAQVME